MNYHEIPFVVTTWSRTAEHGRRDPFGRVGLQALANVLVAASDWLLKPRNSSRRSCTRWTGTRISLRHPWSSLIIRAANSSSNTQR